MEVTMLSKVIHMEELLLKVLVRTLALVGLT